jgi:hypothetical protein
METDNSAVVAELHRLNQIRQAAVISALGLLLISYFVPGTALAVLRTFAWASAGIFSLLYASKAKAAGAPASYLNAVIYFMVALLPLLRVVGN